MKKKFFSGDSVRQAVLQAARYFELDPEAMAYREVDRRHGFLRGRRRAVIEVDQENPTRQLEEAAPSETTDAVESSRPAAIPSEREAVAPPAKDLPAEEMPAENMPTEEMPATVLAEQVAEADAVATAAADSTGTGPFGASRPERRLDAPARSEETFKPLAEEPVPAARRFPQAEGDIAEAAQEALDRLFELGQLDLEAEVLQGEERLEVELSGADEEFLLEDRGRLLLAIQHLLPRMLRGLTGKSAPCWVDCDNFHEIRTEQLRDLAQRIASEVRNSRRSHTLEPMSPDERRIVHLTLADDPAVETVSQGNGLFKRVQVRPLRERPRGFDSYS